VSSPAIVSASRRTDLPAFGAEWFSSCLDAGKAEVRSPYSGRPVTVSLRREEVLAFVFWTRNPRPFFGVLDRLEREGYPSVFQFTLTGHSRAMEPFVPPFPEAVSSFRELSARIGPARVLWRFDPLFPGESPEALFSRFDRVSAALAGLSGRCTLSIASPYRKSLRATRHIQGLWELRDGFREAVERLASLGRDRGFDVRSCCTPLLAEWGIAPAACICAEELRALWPGAEIPKTSSPVRAGCLCSGSRDIGAYRTCRHGCLYCYAA
jgi:hypothetical protein